MAKGLPFYIAPGSGQGCSPCETYPLKTAYMTRCRDNWRPKLLSGFLLIFCLCASIGAQEANRKILKQVEPEYPHVLKKMEIGGTVRLKVIIKADGYVQSTEVLGGNPILAAEAQKAVAQWRFAPGPSATNAEVKILFDPHK